MSAGGFLTGLIVGVALGVAAGALLSPESGKENRTRLAGELARFGNNPTDFVSQLKAEIQDRLQVAQVAYRTGAEETRTHMRHELEAARGSD